MRILQLAPIWETVPPPSYGGTEAVVSVLTEELVRRGHDVTLWASGDSRTSAQLRSVLPSSLRRAGLTDQAMQYALVHVASALQSANEYDIVHNHNGPPSELAMALHTALPNVPMLTTLHCHLTEDTRFVWENYGGWYNTISEVQASVVPHLPKARFAGVVHNSIDVDSFPFKRGKDDYLLYMGRLTPEKPPHLAVEAARRAGMRIVIAGKMAMPWEHEYFERHLEPLLDGEMAIYIGEADAGTKRQLFAGARGLLLPLRWEEPFGLVMAEALACGTPVVAFRRGAAPEIIVDGENGFLVEDVDGMVEAVGRLEAIDPLECRRSVEERFSPAALADRYLAVYARILSAADRPSGSARMLATAAARNGDQAGLAAS
jgi:glycosyltransferase involved in cell wall biosynthesis